ncbi:MAG: hypothetical protein Q8N69_02440 [bacterium]|nr:hypothetical protein [bacterium]
MAGETPVRMRELPLDRRANASGIKAALRQGMYNPDEIIGDRDVPPQLLGDLGMSNPAED